MSKLERYENTLNELRKGLLEKLKDRIKSIVLYGSVARKEASEESDVDIFVVLKDNSLYRKVSDIAYKVDLKNELQHQYFGRPLKSSLNTPYMAHHYWKCGSRRYCFI
jgi:predicted nucleotidyltransferase